MVCFMRVMACLAVVAVLAASASAETGSSSVAAAGTSRLDDAQRLVGEGKYKEAIPVLEEIAASNPASAPQALKIMGNCYKALRKWSKAIECYEKLLAGYPDSVAPDQEVKAWIMDCHLANGDLEKCLSLRKELLSQYQDDAWKLYYVVGRRHIWRLEFSKAIPELKQAVELGASSKNDPEIIDANRRLLHCYVVGKQWDKAEQLADKLLKDYADRAYEWHAEMGKCYQARGEYDKAIQTLELAAQTCPKNYYNRKEMFKGLLDCYDDTSRLDKAIPLAEKLVGDYPEESAWQWRLGWYYLTKRQYDKAAPMFERVIKSSKARWEIRKAQIYLGQCLFNLGKGHEALEMIETYFKDKPELWDDHLLVKSGVLFYGPKDDEGCVAALKELLAQVAGGKKSSLVPTARELLCRALERSGERAAAASTLEEMAAQSNDPILLCRAGQDYYKAGKYTEAKRVYKAATNRAGVPDDIRAQCMHGLALCYWETGLKNAARRLMLRVSEEYPNTQAGMKARGSLYLWSQGD